MGTQDGLISHVQSGFNYFNPHGLDGSQEIRHTVSIIGTKGSMGLVGLRLGSPGSRSGDAGRPGYERHNIDRGEFVWQMGASLAARCLATGEDLLITPEHALHVLEIIQATRESQETGRRIQLTSTFKWPVVSSHE
jgi:predicted dehydrogenase